MKKKEGRRKEKKAEKEQRFKYLVQTDFAGMASGVALGGPAGAVRGAAIASAVLALWWY